jgi:PPOX class probable F420-dependent enzyme
MADSALIVQQAGSMRRFGGRYLSLTTYRRDGAPVATPVWFVEDNGVLLVQTDAASGKVKRIRRSPNVRVGLCTASGRLLGPEVVATAALLEPSETSRVARLIQQKYRIDALIIRPLWIIKSKLHIGKPRTHLVILSITPAS